MPVPSGRAMKLEGIAATGRATLATVKSIGELMMEAKHRIRRDFGSICSQDLLNNLFRSPNTRIQFVRDDLGVSRVTATRYLKMLEREGFLVVHKLGRSKHFVSRPLLDLLLGVEGSPADASRCSGAPGPRRVLCMSARTCIDL